MKDWLKQVATIAVGVFAGLALTAAVAGIIMLAITAWVVNEVGNNMDDATRELQRTTNSTPAYTPTPYPTPTHSLPTPDPTNPFGILDCTDQTRPGCSNEELGIDPNANQEEGDGSIDGKSNPYN